MSGLKADAARGASVKRTAAFVAAAAFVFALAACASRPEGNLIPVSVTTPGTTAVEMLIATTRAEDPRPGVMFNGERAHGLRFADIGVSIPPDANRKIGDVQWPSSVPGDPARDFVTLRADMLDLPQLKSTFDDRLKWPDEPRADLRPRLQHALRGGGLSLRANRPQLQGAGAAIPLHVAVAWRPAQLCL